MAVRQEEMNAMTVDNQGSNEGEAIKRRLYVKEEDVVKKLDSLLARVEKYLSLEASTGTIILKRTDLSLKTRICLILMGHYFYEKAEGRKSTPLAVSELAKILRKPITSLSGPLGELQESGYVEKVETGKYQIVYYEIEEFLDEIQKAG